MCHPFNQRYVYFLLFLIVRRFLATLDRLSGTHFRRRRAFAYGLPVFGLPHIIGAALSLLACVQLFELIAADDGGGTELLGLIWPVPLPIGLPRTETLPQILNDGMRALGDLRPEGILQVFLGLHVLLLREGEGRLLGFLHQQLSQLQGIFLGALK